MRRRVALFAAVPLALVGLYAVLGTLLAPPLIAWAIARHDARTPGIELRVGAVEVQPFRLQVELAEVNIRTPVGPDALMARRILLAWRPAALPWRAPRLVRLELDAPHLILESPPCCRHVDLQQAAPALEAALARVAPWRPNILLASSGRVDLAGGDNLPERLRGLSDMDVRIQDNAPGPGAAWVAEFTDATGMRLALDGLLVPESGELRGQLRATRDAGTAEVERAVVAKGTFTASLGPEASAWRLQAQLELVEARLSGEPQPLVLRLQHGPQVGTLEAQGIPASALSGFAARAFGRGLTSGRVGLVIEQRRADGQQFDGTVQVTAHGLSLAPGTSALPLELVLALLEDAEGDLVLHAPLVVDAADELSNALMQALIDELERLSVDPFATLGAMAGHPGARLEQWQFRPGSAAPDATLEAALDVFAEALEARPRLAVILPAAFHPVQDRHALAARQVELHVALATAEAAFRARAAPLDFSSARVRDILEEFAGERFGVESLASIRANFAEAEEAAYSRALFEVLAATEPMADAALPRLARFRARALADGLSARGIAPARIVIGEVSGEAVGGMERVVLRAELIPVGQGFPDGVGLSR